MKRLYQKVKCLIMGHQWKDTEIFHIEYIEEDYEIDQYYVRVCSCCGKRHHDD